MAQILVVDDEVGIRELLSEILADEGHQVLLAESAGAARRLRERVRPDLVLLDIWMPDTDGISLLKEWAASGQLTMPVVMMSGHGTIETAVEATRIGAFDFLEKPIGLTKLLGTITRALKSAAAQEPTRISLAPLGLSPAVREAERALEKLAAARKPILILGEPGTGHDVAARALASRDAPYLVLGNGGRLTANALGVLEEARDGVVHLQEIGAYAKPEQKALSFLLGKLDRSNVQLVATSVEPLGNLAGDGRFDPALLSQLAQGAVILPPLRERRADIPVLVERMWREGAADDDTMLANVSPSALATLTNANWPGNLDHLAAVVANLRITRGEITPEHVKRLLGEPAAPPPAVTPEIAARFFDLPLREAREAFERLYFEQLLGREQSNMSKVAEKAGLERTHLYRKLKQLNIRFSRRGDDPVL
jgi:DNA-binding NtrC family response regulator